AVKMHIDSQGNREITFLNPEMIEDQTTLGIEDNENTNISDKFLLKQNFPNPFNSNTTIQFDIPLNPPLKGGTTQSGGYISLNIYDVNGKEIATLIDNINTSGSYQVDWNASSCPSGIYFYTLRTKDFAKTRKMLLLR
ncbi:T9SS type A sorting domain-containing protein, partial [bacterium]|nr:T9SS type A sorting domain-containing protein [bacterium]